MKPGTITHTIAVVLSSVSSLFAQTAVQKTSQTKIKLSKKSAEALSEDTPLSIASIGWAPKMDPPPQASDANRTYQWKTNIVTTVFWIGEAPSENNPVPNRASSWDKNWTSNYGGGDCRDTRPRTKFYPGKISSRRKYLF